MIAARKSRLVRARRLPARFEIATTWHEPAIARAEKRGSFVRVRIMGATLDLAPEQRVRVLIREEKS